MIRAVDHLKASLTSLAYMQARCMRGDSAYTYPGGAADYVLDRGAGFESRALNAEQREYVRSFGNRWRLKECFYNGQMLADSFERLTYCEGFAFGNSGIPIHHGWAVLDGTHVIDLTWRTNLFTKQARRVKGLIPSDWAYFGVLFRPHQGHLHRGYESYLHGSDALQLYRQPRKSAPEWEAVGKLFDRVLSSRST